MKDRVPRYPGRVLMRPVPLQPNVYDMVRADSPTEDGTPLNKGTLLSDQVCERLEIPITATPNDALNRLSGIPVIHVWRNKSIVSESGYTIEPVKNNDYIFYDRDSGSGKNVWIDWNISASPLLVKPDGTAFFPTTKRVGMGDALTTANSLKGKFISLKEQGPGTSSSGVKGSVVYIPPDAETGGEDYTGAVWFKKYAPVTTYPRVSVETQYVFSFDRYKYSGDDYEYLGILSDKIGSVSGFYIGDGTFGQESPTSIEFSRPPKMISIVRDGGDIGVQNDYAIWFNGVSRFYGSHSPVSVSGNTLSWYSTEATQQYNSLGETYRYFALL